LKAEKLKESTVREIAHPTYFVPGNVNLDWISNGS